MSNPLAFGLFFQSPTGRNLMMCIERIDVSLRGIAESLEKIANPLIANPLISVDANETFVDVDGIPKTRPRR